MEQRDFKKPRPDAHYHTLLNHGIADVKEGKLQSARETLMRAIELNPHDPLPWLWLSRTTRNPDQILKCLENAVAADPMDAQARSAIARFQAARQGEKVLAPGQPPTLATTDDEAEQEAETHRCPNCGGQMTFNPSFNQLDCQQCGHTTPLTLAAATSEKLAIEYALVSERGHRWATTHHRVTCQQCGAVSHLPPTTTSTDCPYCGSNQLVSTAPDEQMIPPHAVLPFKVEQDTAYKRFRRWLGNSFFAPDDLSKMATRATLRPAYYPFWIFDTVYHANYSVEINEGTNKNPRWVHHTGTEVLFYDNVIVPGNRRITPEDLKRIEPFKTEALLDYNDAVLVGWPAFSYDIALSDASIEARSKIIEHARPRLYNRIAAGREIRKLQISTGDFSSKSYKHVLLPLWVGIYTYAGQEYHILINGQTGKVGGKKPIDRVKIWLLAAMGGIILFFLAAYVILANWRFLFGA